MAQVTFAGHLPSGAVLSTVHVQVTIPNSSAVFCTSPESLLGTLLYSTVILQLAFGFVLTVSDVFSPGATGDVNDWTDALTFAVGDGWEGVFT